MIYGSANPDEVRSPQEQLGVERAGQLVEDALAQFARGVRERGLSKRVVAGGKITDTVVKAQDVTSL